VPTFRGSVEVWLPAPPPSHSHATFALAFAQDYVPEAGDAFETLADRLAAWLTAGAPQRAIPSLVADGQPAGRAIARLHASLARVFPTRAARPEDIGRWRQRAARAHRTAVFRIRSVDPARATWLAEHRSAIEAALAPLAAQVDAQAAADAGAGAPRTLQRIHADLHLGQLLRDGYQFLIADLEGEPTRPVAERRRLDTPLRDLASMLRSFDHVARSGMRRSGVPLDEVAAGSSAADPATEAWLAAVRTAFLEAYLEESDARGRSVEIDRALLHALEVEKELYEFSYAATYLPAWRYAPAAGMRWLLDRPGAGSTGRRSAAALRGI
jgi:predicted trehalose synthase